MIIKGFSKKNRKRRTSLHPRLVHASQQCATSTTMPLALDNNTLACTYASLILHDDGLPITEANVNKLIAASGVEVPSFWPKLFVSAMKSEDMTKLCCSLPDGGAGGDAPAGGAAPAAAAPADNKKDDKKAAKKAEPEEDEDMGFSLFD